MIAEALRGGTGLVLGKFMPPHMGHVYLIDFARRYVDDLSVVVASLEEEPIPGTLRYAWIREIFPDVRIVHLTDPNPSTPDEHPRFWEIWQESLLRVLPRPPDYVFTSEDYGDRLAEVLGGMHIPVDRERAIVPVSSTAIRTAPLRNWHYLPPCVRPYYLRRVCIFGPESTGKTTLARHLAERFNTVCVPEHARTLLAAKGGAITASDITKIARGQIASEEALARQANRVLVCDTDLLTTTIWSETLYGQCPAWIREEARRRTYDLYLLTDIDVPWISDPVRYLPKEGAHFLARCEAALRELDRPYVRVSGNWAERFETARAAVEGLLSDSSPEPCPRA